jgi:hypothetical protein
MSKVEVEINFDEYTIDAFLDRNQYILSRDFRGTKPTNNNYPLRITSMNIQGIKYPASKRTVKFVDQSIEEIVVVQLPFPEIYFSKVASKLIDDRLGKEFVEVGFYTATKIQDKFYSLGMPNMTPEGITCLGSLSGDLYVAEKDYSLKEAIDAFWFASFTTESVQYIINNWESYLYDREFDPKIQNFYNEIWGDKQ